ncbi:hypothetical protein ACFLQW_02155 [Candidatus Zixiibacteriota bacterium]
MNTFRRYAVCGLITSVMVLLSIGSAAAEWRVAFESKTAYAGQTGVTMTVNLTTELPMIGFTLPVVVRELTPGSFWTGELPYDTGGTAFT